MSLEIGPLNPYQPAAAARAAAQSAELPLPAARPSAPVGDTAQLSLTAYPPPEVLDEVGAAADRADELWAANRELHFRTDEDSGRVIVEVRDLDGNVIRTIPPSQALEVMSGAAL
jgi:hypothetical protein